MKPRVEGIWGSTRGLATGTKEHGRTATSRAWSVLFPCLAVAACAKPVAPLPAEPLASPLPESEPERRLRALVERETWGTSEGSAVERFTLTNDHGLRLAVINYGATVVGLEVPDNDGNLVDVVLGFDDLSGYRNGRDYFGATLGRVANRIEKSAFKLGAKTVQLVENFEGAHYNGGFKGWDKMVWEGEEVSADAGPSVEFTYFSPAGEERYPGAVTASVVYTLTQDDEVRIEMSATTDAPTVVNMSNFTYLNLAGHDAGNALSQSLKIFATKGMQAKRATSSKQLRDLAGTPFDFSTAKPIAEGGTDFDYDFLVDGAAGTLRPVAELSDVGSGRKMTLLANQPSVRLETANQLNGTARGKGTTYEKHAGVALATQALPNAIHVDEWREQVVVGPDAPYEHVVVMRFSAD